MKSRFHRPQVLLAALSAAAIVVLGACGGGGAASPATGGTASALSLSGTITGFGSVIIDGVRYDDTKASVAIDTNPAAPTDGTLSDLKLGMQVEAKVVDGKLADVTVHAALFGPIASIDVAGASFTLYGQTVKVLTTGATPTVFEGAADLAGLAVGDVVEVHGSVDASKAVTATRIERKPRTDLAKGVRIGGVVNALDTTAKTFRFNDMTVDYSAAAVLPAGTALANGQLVAAFSDTPPGAGGFHAQAIKIVTTTDGGEFGVGGRIMAFTSLADFTVSGVRIDASAAALEGGVAADLAAGVIVGAEGTVVDGVLKASKLRILKTAADVHASLSGQVTDWLSASSFKVRGTAVDAGTAVFVGGSASDLGNGAWVQITGTVKGDVLKADQVSFKAPPVAQSVKLMGEVREYNAEARTFHFLGVNLKLADAVEFVGGTLADIVNGKRVEATGTPGADGVVVVTRLAFLGDLAPTPAVVGGRIFDLGDSGFKLPGLAVSFNADTVFDGGTRADLATGALVLAKGRFNAQTQTVAATWIEIITSDAGVPRVAGAVGDFVSTANFRVGGQKVDAGQASFVDGTAADLANGAVVEAVGALVERDGVKVLVATKLRLLVK